MITPTLFLVQDGGLSFIMGGAADSLRRMVRANTCGAADHELDRIAEQ